MTLPYLTITESGTYDGQGASVSGVKVSEGVSDVVIRGYVIRAERVGVYVNKDCKNVTIERCDITAWHPGIYLDQCSHITVRDNYIHDTGWYYWIGRWPWKFRRFGIDMREGIAIDDSQHCIITENTIEDCALAGITLYRNCGEFKTHKRGEGSVGNQITLNTIRRCPVGIWEAARKWRDLITWNCACPGKWVPIWKVPKLPFQQVLNWNVVFWPFVRNDKFRFPLRWRLWIVEDVATDNVFGGNVIECETQIIGN